MITRDRLEIVYSHFPISVKILEDYVVIENFGSGRGKRLAKIIGVTSVEVDGDDIVAKGKDTVAVDQTAANKVTKVKKKGPRVFLDGIYICQKNVGVTDTA